MGTRRIRSWGRLAVATSLLGSGMLLLPPLTYMATAASFVQIPTRLYMVPAGVTVPNIIANALDVKVGTLEFDGSTDPISQDVRTIEVDTIDSDTPVTCDLIDEVPGVQDYDIDDCSRVQLEVTHGRISMGPVVTDLFRDFLSGGPLTDDNPADPVYRYGATGAVLESFGGGGDPTNPNDPAGFFQLNINGTKAQLNAALGMLTFTPDSDYYYDGTNPATLTIDVISGDPDLASPLTGTTIEIRVLNINSFPVVEPPANQMAQAGVELKFPAADPELNPPFTGRAYTVTDPDNDENVDGMQADPPVAEDPLVDGAGDKMLLVGYLDCGVPTSAVADVNGFHFRGGTFLVDNNDIQGIVRDFFDFTLLPAEGQTAITAVLDAIELIEPGLTTRMLATNNPATYTDLFAGVGTMLDVQYAMSQITFLQPAPNDTCTLWTFVSDLGNNGLPIQYFGDPPTGIEVPMIGFDVDSVEITTGDLDEIAVGFDVSTIAVVEGDPGDPGDPATAVAGLTVSPTPHPEFTVQWEANPKSGDPVLVGQAEPNVDFSGTSNNNPLIPADDTSITVGTHPTLSLPDETIFRDNVDEGNEVFTYEFVLDANDAPPGYVIVPGANPTVTVTIIDDDDADAGVTTFADVSGDEGDTGDSNSLTFTIGLDKPADGGETVDITLTPGSATNPGDYGAPSTATVTFDPLATSATFAVPIVGDEVDEGDHSFTATLSNASGLTLTDTTATGTILDDDVTSVVSIADGSVNEVDGSATVVVSMTNFVPGRLCSLTMSSVDGSAVTPQDYDPVTGTFNLGAVSDSLGVNAVDDDLVEPNQTYTVSFVLHSSSDAQCELGDAEATITIVSDDVPVMISIDDALVAEGVGIAELTVNTSNPAVLCQVLPTTTDGTALDGNDFTSFSGATFNVNGSDPLPISIIDDSDDDDGETFTVDLAFSGSANPRCQFSDDSATILIADNDGVADVTPPTVTINQAVGQPDPTSTGSVEFTVVFSEPVFGFGTSDILLSGSAQPLGATISGSGPTYTVLVLPINNPGLVVATIAAAGVTDSALNPNAASTSADNEVTFDLVGPTVTIDQAGAQIDPTTASPILFTVVFSEPVANFATGDVTLSGTAGATTAAVSGSGTTYTVAVSGMTNDGTVVASLAAGVATDAATNPSDASTSVDNEVTFDFVVVDNTSPTVTINQAVGQADPATTQPILFTVVFSEPVTGFAAADLLLAGTAGASTATVSGSGTTYTVSVDGLPGPGSVIVSVVAGAAVDAALNVSAASTSTDNTVTYDPTDPIVLDLPGDITKNNDPGQAGALVTFPAVTASGGVAPVTVSCDSTSGSFFPLGTTVVTCIATDSESSGGGERFVEASTTGTFSITILDNEDPVIAQPPNLTRTSTSLSGTSVTYITPTATDNGGTPTVSCTPASGIIYKVGVTTVTCTAVDAAGNAASASFTITVTAPASGVPVTGADSTTTMLIAAAFVSLGWLLTQANRRRRSIV